MDSYIVMQGDTYKEEKAHGIIKAPMKDKAGTVPHSWERVARLKKGDRTFHYAKGELVAVGTIREDAKAAMESGAGHWESPCEYLELQEPLEIGSHISRLAPHFPLKYSAFQPDGNGNSGYLYPCNEQLALELLAILAVAKWRHIEQLEFIYESVHLEKYNSLTAWMMDTEFLIREKITSYTSRFRQELLERWGHSCAVCGLPNEAVLRAVYCKPWTDSSDQERIDPANGVLLCANHAALYEDGQISFTGAGTLRMVKELQPEALRYNLKKHTRIQATEENTPYFRWHRNNLFKS